MASSDSAVDDSLYPIAVLIDELKNEDVQVCTKLAIVYCNYLFSKLLIHIIINISLRREKVEVLK